MVVGLLTKRAVKVAEALAGSGDLSEWAAVGAWANAGVGIRRNAAGALVLAGSRDTSEIGLDTTDEWLVSDLSLSREGVGDNLTVNSGAGTRDGSQRSQKKTGKLSVAEIDASSIGEVEEVSLSVAGD